MQIENVSEISPSHNPTPRVRKIDSLGRSYGTGRRKTSVARVWIKKGTGKFTINGREVTNYFGRTAHQLKLSEPFNAIKQSGSFDVVCTVVGGGHTGQAEAIRHGISRALVAYEPDEWAPILSKNKLLTRDNRMVESKKYGRHKARRSYQFSKR